MTAITVDVKQGMARDHGELIINERDPFQIVVDISIEDDDQICFDYLDPTTAEKIYLFLPADRVRKLLAQDEREGLEGQGPKRSSPEVSEA